MRLKVAAFAAREEALTDAAHVRWMGFNMSAPSCPDQLIGRLA